MSYTFCKRFTLASRSNIVGNLSKHIWLCSMDIYIYIYIPVFLIDAFMIAKKLKSFTEPNKKLLWLPPYGLRLLSTLLCKACSYIYIYIYLEWSEILTQLPIISLTSFSSLIYLCPRFLYLEIVETFAFG